MQVGGDQATPCSSNMHDVGFLLPALRASTVIIIVPMVIVTVTGAADHYGLLGCCRTGLDWTGLAHESLAW